VYTLLHLEDFYDAKNLSYLKYYNLFKLRELQSYSKDIAIVRASCR